MLEKQTYRDIETFVALQNIKSLRQLRENKDCKTHILNS